MQVWGTSSAVVRLASSLISLKAHTVGEFECESSVLIPHEIRNALVRSLIS